MKNPVNGIHHITALASDPQRIVDFYVNLLGLRLVKQTVNFDAPDVYHLYYGDEVGTPGTLLTFFPFPFASRGKRGTGEASAVAFSIKPESLDYWIDRFARLAVHFDGPAERFNETVVSLEDPDGMRVELVARPEQAAIRPWLDSPVSPNYALQGFHGMTLTLAAGEMTMRFLNEVTGFSHADSDGKRTRFLAGEASNTAAIDLIIVNPFGPEAQQSAGSVHHIAWRVPDDESLARWQDHLSRAGVSVTPVSDRHYFHSIYFHEPGGVLFEIATDSPGFLVDEQKEALGTSLKLPPWLEERRRRIEETLPPLTFRLPGVSEREDVSS